MKRQISGSSSQNFNGSRSWKGVTISLCDFFLEANSLFKILSSMDTEYDKMALKAVIFVRHSRAETNNLGINRTRAVQFLSNVVAASEESKRVLDATKDIY